MPAISVILCTRDPHPGRLAQTLAGLAAQDLDLSKWELLLIDNGSTPPLSPATLPPAPGNLRVIREPAPGLTPARLRGIDEARGDLLVFVDDDNVLVPAFLSTALSVFQANHRLAVAGGPVSPEFEKPPEDWTREFFPLLALHNHGTERRLVAGAAGLPYPNCAPVGAGLCIRRDHALAYAQVVRTDPARTALDRRGGALTSGGDNDIVFTALHAGGDVGYFPELALVHLIPTGRLDPVYLARLNRGIQRSWVRVLHLHGQNPWRKIPRWSVPLRALRAYIRTQAWRGPAHRVRFAGLLGRLEGQADIPRA